MASHEEEIATFGANDDFWLFGYGYGHVERDVF